MRFARLANHFGSRYRHLLIAMDGRTKAWRYLSPDLAFEILDIRASRGALTANPIRFRWTLKRLRPDLLLTSNWGSIEWAVANLFVGVQHLHYEDGFGPDEQERRHVRRDWARRIALFNSIVIVPSLTLQRVARSTWRMPERRVLYIPNGVDVARFAPKPTGDNEPARVGTVATLRKEKNLNRLIDAFNHIRARVNAQLVIVGDGPERKSLESYAEAQGLSGAIRFTGNLTNPEEILSTFDVFAISSDTEQMPLSLLEAMAAGCAVAATNVGDIPEIVAEENRRYIVERDSVALGAAIESLLGDATERSRIGTANRRRVTASFNQNAMFETYRRLWDGEVQPGATRRP